MSPEAFNQALAELGLSQAELARRLSAACGRVVRPALVWRYSVPAARGGTKVPAGLCLALEVMLDHHRRGIELRPIPPRTASEPPRSPKRRQALRTPAK